LFSHEAIKLINEDQIETPILYKFYNLKLVINKKICMNRLGKKYFPAGMFPKKKATPDKRGG